MESKNETWDNEHDALKRIIKGFLFLKHKILKNKKNMIK
jgi:hypothetical protein